MCSTPRFLILVNKISSWGLQMTQPSTAPCKQGLETRTNAQETPFETQHFAPGSRPPPPPRLRQVQHQPRKLLFVWTLPLLGPLRYRVPPLPAPGAPAWRRGGALPFVVGPSFPGHRAALGWGYADKALGGGAVAAASAAAGEGQLEAGAR